MLGGMKDKLVTQLQSVQKESNEQVKQLNSELQQLAELLNQSLDLQNDLVKGQITIYNCLVAMAEKQGVELPDPLTKMEIE